MTKTLIRNTAELAGQVVSYLLPATLWRRLANLRDFAYTGYLRRRFAHLGKSVIAWRALKLHGLERVSIGDDTNIDSGIQLTTQPAGRVTIGNHCLIRANCHITAADSITIGDHLLTGTNVLITDNAHGLTTHEHMELPPRERPIVSKGPVVIGNNVWLGNNVCVLAGVTIGDGAVVGANSVVTHDIPAYSIAAGIPAQLVRQN